MKLYSYYRSSCSYRVRIALNLKSIQYDYEAIHLLKEGGQQFSPPYSSKNPGQKVPAIEWDETTLAESVSIIEFLDEKYPDNPLFPAELLPKARMRQYIEIINSGIQPLQNLSLLIHLKKELGINDEQKVAWIQHWISTGFQSLENHLAKQTKAKYSMGDKPMALDCFLVPQVYNANRFNVNMNLFPTLKRVNDLCLEHPAFQKAHPSQQPDAPKE